MSVPPVSGSQYQPEPPSNEQGLTPYQKQQLTFMLEALQFMEEVREYDPTLIDNSKSEIENLLNEKPPLSPAIRQQLEGILNTLKSVSDNQNNPSVWTVELNGSVTLLNSLLNQNAR